MLQETFREYRLTAGPSALGDLNAGRDRRSSPRMRAPRRPAMALPVAHPPADFRRQRPSGFNLDRPAAPIASLRSSAEREKSGILVHHKAIDFLTALGVCRRAVPQPDPDHFRRCPVEDAEPLKVFVLADDYKPVVAGMLPDRAIVATRQATLADVDAAWLQIREVCDEPRREIFVKEQHPLLSLQGCSPLDVRARRQTPNRPGCRRSSVAENRLGPAARSCRRQGTRARHRQ
jgi:hypothetical protein